MEHIISLILNPQLIALLGPTGVILLVGGWLWYRQYKHILTKYEEVQEKRIQESQLMMKEYQEFTVDITKTLDAVLDVIRDTNNGGK